MGIDNEDPREQEVLRMMAENELVITNAVRAKIIGELRGGDDEENESINSYLTVIDSDLLELAREEGFYDEIEEVLDRIEWEIEKIIEDPDLKEAFARIVETAQQYGEAVKEMLQSRDLVFFKHFISEIRAVLLILQEQEGEDVVRLIADKTEKYLGVDERTLIEEELEADSLPKELLLRTIKLESEGVDQAIAARRARVEINREVKERANQQRDAYVEKIRQIYGLKDGKLPV